MLWPNSNHIIDIQISSAAIIIDFSLIKCNHTFLNKFSDASFSAGIHVYPKFLCLTVSENTILRDKQSPFQDFDRKINNKFFNFQNKRD